MLFAWLEVDGEAALDQTCDTPIHIAGPYPHTDQRRRPPTLYTYTREREVDDLALVSFARLEFELNHLRTVADHGARRLFDAEIAINGDRQLLGHFLTLMGGEVENDGDFAFTAFACDKSGHAAEACKVNDHAVANTGQDRRNNPDIAGRDVSRPAIMLAAERVEQTPVDLYRHAPETAAFTNADLGGGEPAGGGGEINLFGCGHDLTNGGLP